MLGTSSCKFCDICEIQTKRASVPKKDWLTIVKTARARSKSRRYLREQGIVGWVRGRSPDLAAVQASDPKAPAGSFRARFDSAGDARM